MQTGLIGRRITNRNLSGLEAELQGIGFDNAGTLSVVALLDNGEIRDWIYSDVRVLPRNPAQIEMPIAMPIPGPGVPR
jgi:hypothetical protein